MSKENTECDVRVALYDGSRTPIAHIIFFNDCELLLECERVIIERDGNRLYFKNGNNVSDSVKLTQKDKNTLQLWKDYSKARDLEGTYDLKYDQKSNTYYIDKQEKLGEYYHHVVRKGIKQINHNPGIREKGVSKTMSPVTISERGKKAIELKTVQEKNSAKNVVVHALVSLLKTQITGNDEAMITLTTLETYLK